MRPILLCVLSLPLLAHAEPGVAVAAPGAATTPALPLRARLDEETIRAAIAALPAERHPDPGRREAPALSATAHDAFARDFAAARLPDCLHAEGLRNQPTFFLGGVLALPFIAVAKLRGVCR